MELNEPTALAASIAIALGLMRALEHIVGALIEKFKKHEEKPTTNLVVQLDPAVSRMISEAHERITDMHRIMLKTDIDGSPLVYSSRTGIDLIRNTTSMMQDVSRTQERIASTLEKVSDATSERISQEISFFHATSDSLKRIETKLQTGK